MDGGAQIADVPNWRTHDTWQYNVTIAAFPGNHTATVRISGWGEYLDLNNTKFETFEIIYSSNAVIHNDSFGTVWIRDRDLRGITRTDYKTTFSRRYTNFTYQYGFDNYSVSEVTDYNIMLDPFGFPLQVGDEWNQVVTAEITTQIEVEKPTGTVISVDNESRIMPIYYKCTAVQDIILNTTDNMESLIDPSIEGNWIAESVSVLIIVQDDEEQDTDGTYTVDYYNVTKGNIVRKEIWEGGELNVTWSLVYTDYTYSGDPFVPPERPDDGDPEVFLCLFGLVIMAILILAFIVIRRRSIPKEERFTKEYIETVDTKTELIELCEEAKLSTKGAKSQLRKRLLTYVEELELEEREKKQEGEDFEDEVLSSDYENLEKDIDELTLDEEDAIEEDGDSLS